VAAAGGHSAAGTGDSGAGVAAFCGEAVGKGIRHGGQVRQSTTADRWERCGQMLRASA